MAGRNHSRSTRRGRPVGDARPRPRPTAPRTRALTARNRTELSDIRLRIDISAAVAAIVAQALRGQRADSDLEAATALQRCVCDVLAVQSARLQRIIAGCDAARKRDAP